MDYFLLFSLYAGILTWLGLKKEEEEEDPLITIIKMGILSLQKEEYNNAESTLHLALKMAQERANTEAETYIYDILANVAFQKEDYAKAEKLFLEVTRRILTQGKAEDDDAVIEISLKLSKIYSKLKQYDKAETGFKFCIHTQQKKLDLMKLDNTLTEEQQNTLVLWAMGIDWYARHLMDRGYLQDAQKYFEKALAVSERINGASHPQTLVLINDIGSVASLRKDFDSAVEMFKTAIERSKENETPDLSSFYCNLGTTYIRKGEPVLARSACHTALKLAKKFKNKLASEDAKECLQELENIV
ncbi:tetratricopeptide repeat protein 19, mitochondrial-like [Centruroides sculpturatus]|uniref:tetratricopeptide repeat protein 19, mitochondrial-like n=1 Tax=Centruroides sculpturatus TaxID=218467 RepID=UPI000C6DFA16|nr:tetratricopeptide repeat protein 19, mitochondrial-like [Centruroides sculpturatus]